ncbi:MAG: DUF2924 domain-containing protein [Parvularculaceae bacterium]
MSRPVDIEKLESEIEALDHLPFPDLKARYVDLCGDAPPRRISRKMLALAVAYEMQRKTFGVRTDRLASRLKALGGGRESYGKRSRSGYASAPIRIMKPGGRLVREWRGRTYEVYVAEDGCYLDGVRYKSLTAAAEAITGAKWNGPRFFGLRSPRVK